MNVGLTSLCRGHASLPCIIPISFITFHVGAVCPGLAWIMESLTWVCIWTCSWTLWTFGWTLVDIHWWTLGGGHGGHLLFGCENMCGKCLGHVWEVSGTCLGHVWKVFGTCLKVFGKCWRKFGETFWTSVWGWSGGCLGLVWDLSGKCLESLLEVFRRCLGSVWASKVGSLQKYFDPNLKGLVDFDLNPLGVSD